MRYEELVAQLSQLHDKVQCMVASMDGDDYRKQYHPDLSPLRLALRTYNLHRKSMVARRSIKRRHPKRKRPFAL